ncbi:MAG TPA: HAD family hydrolase [Stellaceae bacterium]|nr:HAD family hydrolase [Stellaceae bacterium]
MPLSMVGRRREKTPVLILDLDGTVLSENSFPRWALHLVRARFPHLRAPRRWRISATAVAMIAVRKLRLMSHDWLKWRLQALWQIATAGDGGAAERDIVQELIGIVRPELAPVLGAVAACRVDAILATAAPEDYADGLGCRLGFADVLATRCGRLKPSPDNSGPYKRDAVMRLIVGRGWLERPRILFTDHVDDIPLMRVCQTIYWFGPDSGLAAIMQAVPSAVLRDGRRDFFPIEALALSAGTRSVRPASLVYKSV